jgi:hypothetical protein
MIESVQYIAIFLLLAFLIVAVIFLISQQKVLQLVEPGFRLIKPGQVWLQLIPAFGLVWAFVVVTRISQAIKSQLTVENEDSILGSPVDPSHRPTYRTGIAYCIFISAGALLGLLPSFGIQSLIIGIIQSLLNLIGLIIWIVYWIDLDRYKKMLKLRSVGSIAG